MFFEEIVKRISPTLKRITYKLDSCSVFAGKEDLYQEALMRLWQDYQAGKLDNKTDSYILQGCYFHLKNYLRKVKIRASLFSLNAMVNEEGCDLEEKLCLENKKTQGYCDELNNKMLADIIYNNGFSQREKSILSFFGDGLTTRQIGERIGVSHVRVVKLMSGIRRKCRKYINDYY